MLLLTLVPALLIIIYTLYTQMRAKSVIDLLLVAMGGIVAVCNAAFMYAIAHTASAHETLLCIQQVMSCMIVPIAYSYFARQMGRGWLNPTSVNLWLMMLGLALPSGYYFLDGMAPDMQSTTLSPMSLHLFLHGEEVYAMRLADIIVLCQALFTLARMFVLVQKYRRYGIKPSSKIRYFIYWWGACIVFIAVNAVYNVEPTSTSPGLLAYYVAYSLLIVAIFLLISLNLDLRPSMTRVDDDDDPSTGLRAGSDDPATELRADADEEDEKDEKEKIDNLDSFFLHSQMVAEHVRMILKDEKRCCDASLTVDTVIRDLGTNRTYFYRIMKAEFGRTFNELLLNVRMKHATDMLTTTHTPIHEIAACCGFADSNSFTRRFKQVYGVTPLYFREQNKL